MLALTIASFLLTTSAATEGSAAKPPAPPSAADSIVAAAFKKDIGTKLTTLKAEAPSFSIQNLVAPALGICGLAALAFTLKRRKKLQGGSIHIIEATSLGEKRSLVIADVMGERLVLGVSEAGVSVLMNRPTPLAESSSFFMSEAPAVLEPAPTTAPVMGFFARLKGQPPVAAFENSLQESIEDQELRAKLASGMRGFVP